jgi:hypothetical protein
MTPFNPREHLIQLPRKVKDKASGTWKTILEEYLEVKWRVLMFRERYPHGMITTEEVSIDLDRGYARYKATVEDGEGGKATGYGTETQADFADFCERAETRALGRALAVMGFGTQFVGQDLTEGEHVADAPVRHPVAQPVNSDAGEFSIPTIENASNGDARPQTIPLDAGVPCGGVAIDTLKPGQLSMVLSKVASLVHAQGDTFVPLLAALQREKARRQEPGRIVPVVPPPDAAEEARALEAIAQAIAPTTAEAETAEPDREVAERQRWGALSRRSMKAGLSPSIWESLRQAGDYRVAETMITALESASVADAPARRA